MSDDRTEAEFPDEIKRLAVAYSKLVGDGINHPYYAHHFQEALASAGLQITDLTPEEAQMVLSDLAEFDAVMGGGPDHPVDVAARAKIQALAQDERCADCGLHRVTHPVGGCTFVASSPASVDPGGRKD